MKIMSKPKEMSDIRICSLNISVLSWQSAKKQQKQQIRHYNKLSCSKIIVAVMSLLMLVTTKKSFVNSFIGISRTTKRMIAIAPTITRKSGLQLSYLFNDKRMHTTVSLTSSSSWMEKNERFESNNNNNYDSSKMNTKKKRKNNENYSKKDEAPSGIIISDDADTKQRSPSFREDFRATRVFVQNIPLYATWQDLKDHFRIAGNVVFASVSMNPSSGTSKGCGVVQFETVAEAKNAIANMRNYPMGESQLYVRTDHQEQQEQRAREEDVYSSFKNQRMGGGSGVLRSERMNKNWSCADESTNSALDDSAKEQIMAILRARDAARFRRNYEASDTMREELKKTYNVHLDDRTFLWWVNINSNPNKTISSKSSGAGTTNSATYSPWTQIPSTPENDLCVDANLVNGLLLQRDIARREKDFSTADKLLEQATNAPDDESLKLRIHDESRTWRIWTDAPPPRRRSFSLEESSNDDDDNDNNKKEEVAITTNKKKSILQECIALVSKYDPEKVEQVRELLNQFPARQETIFSKLKQRYQTHNMQ